VAGGFQVCGTYHPGPPLFALTRLNPLAVTTPISYHPQVVDRKIMNKQNRPTNISVCALRSIFILLLTAGLFSSRASAENDLNTPRQANGDRSASALLADYGLPNKPYDVDARFESLRATVWSENGVRRILLDGWVQIEIGQYRFQAERAVIWINRWSDPSIAEGLVIKEIAVYLDEVSDAARPSGQTTVGNDLLITSVIWGKVNLRSDGLWDGKPHETDLLNRAENRFIDWLKKATETYEGGAVIDRKRFQRRLPILDEALQPAQPAEQVGETGRFLDPGDREVRREPGRPHAVIILPIQNLEYQLIEDGTEGYATLHGNLVVQYIEYAPKPGEKEARRLTLQADRIVLFTDPISRNDILTGQLSAESVRGIYLEGNVIGSDGKYTLRGPRMYYDFHTNRAIVPDAVLSTYSKTSRTPIYLRADSLRQTAIDQWQADEISISTSEFFTPSISLSASSVTLDRLEDDYEKVSHRIDARNITLKSGDLPIFWWPRYKGPADQIPLRSIEVGANSRDGVYVSSRWDLFALMGWEPTLRQGKIDTTLLLDMLSDRGPAIGLDVKYNTPDHRGHALGYLLMDDDGTDHLSSGVKRERSNDNRGIIDWAHRYEPDDDWTFLFELSSISDPAFIDSFFNDWGAQRRQFQTRAYAKMQRDNWALEMFGNYDLNNFTPNEDLLQSQIYTVEKMPEVGFYRIGRTFWNDRLVYSSEYRVSRMRFSLPRMTLSEIGQGQTGFGYDPDQDLSMALLAAGYTEEFINRFHTRHELAMPMHVGPINVTPFIMGRFTAYDKEFNEFNPRGEDLRWFGAAGLRMSTQLSRVNNSIDNRFLDLHRMRHIIEPYLTLWSADSDADARDYPIYDLDVEGASVGSAIKFGMRNTWQTKRGGPDRWYSTDVFTLDTHVVFHSSEVQGDYAVPLFFDYRPEYSHFGDHARGDFSWLVSDSFAFASHTIYDLNESAVARSSIGHRIDHSSNLFSFTDLRYFDAGEQTLLAAGLGYQLTPRYKFRGVVNYDLDEDEARSFSTNLTRINQQFDVTFGLRYDQYREDTTFSLYFSPKGGGKSFGGPLSDDKR